MGDPIPFLLVVPNTNSNSLFANFEIAAVYECAHPGREDTWIERADAEDWADVERGPVFYTLYGRFDPAKNADQFAGAQAIANFKTLAGAKQLLVALNGPLSEDDDEE